MTMRNTLAQFAGVGTLVVMGRVTFSAGTPSLAALSGNVNLEADVTIADDGTGLVTITVNPFLGPQGVAVGFGTSNTRSRMVSAAAGTYTGNSLAMQFAVDADDGTDTDGNFNFQIWAY